MSKSVMISIRPKWCEKIVNGEKTIEVRKTRPKLNTPFRVYIYCTLPKYPHEDYIRQREPAPQAPAPKLVLCAGGLTMAKSVLISIRPEWCQKIASGEKTIEVRKKRPKLAPPFKCYIYCTL